jgi:hypothetical protein
MNALRRLLCLGATFLFGVPSVLAVTLPHVFGDHMVLQSGVKGLEVMLSAQYLADIRASALDSWLR